MTQEQKEQLLKKHFGHAYGTLHPLMQIAPTLAAMEELEAEVRKEYAAQPLVEWREKIEAAAFKSLGHDDAFVEDLGWLGKEQFKSFIEGAEWMQAQLKPSPATPVEGEDLAIKVIVKDGVPYIDDRLCSYETIEIRSEIKEFAEVNEEFNLPAKYTCVVTEINGFAKIVKQPSPATEPKNNGGL